MAAGSRFAQCRRPPCPNNGAGLRDRRLARDDLNHKRDEEIAAPLRVLAMMTEDPEIVADLEATLAASATLASTDDNSLQEIMRAAVKKPTPARTFLAISLARGDGGTESRYSESRQVQQGAAKGNLRRERCRAPLEDCRTG